jgi:branched-chain amino acid transport system substrate-binding protein
MRTQAMAVLGLFVLAACPEKKPEGTPAPGQPAEAAPTPAPSSATDTIKFGEVGSLTGTEATFGKSTKDGIDLAVKELNEAGGIKGKKVEVVVYDDQSKPEEARTVVTRLITQDHVNVVLGEVASTNSLQMAPICQSNQVPMITPSSTNPKVTQQGDFIFRVCFIDPFQGQVMAKFARQNLKVNKVAVFKDQRSDYSIGLAEYFEREFKALGGEIVVEESYSKGDSDFKAQLTKIRAEKAEAIYVPGYYNDIGLIAKQSRQLGIKAPLLGGDGWESEKLFELGGSALDGCYYSNHYSTETPTPEIRRFIDHFKAAYGGTIPDSLAALGYDAAKVAADAMSRAKTLSGPDVRDAIAATKDFDGVTGRITIDKDRNAVKPAVILRIEGGKALYQTTIAP